jgi:hypothetical protein
VPLITNANQIGLTWLAPVFDGGSPVIDYRLWTDDATGADFIVQEESITSLSYTVQSLTQGSTY